MTIEWAPRSRWRDAIRPDEEEARGHPVVIACHQQRGQPIGLNTADDRYGHMRDLQRLRVLLAVDRVRAATVGLDPEGTVAVAIFVEIAEPCRRLVAPQHEAGWIADQDRRNGLDRCIGDDDAWHLWSWWRHGVGWDFLGLSTRLDGRARVPLPRFMSRVGCDLGSFVDPAGFGPARTCRILHHGQ